ncbi:Cyclic pyranopterin monophosphate synthase [Polystyrenella longa]|uniref:GTP 3',8-cyclase n=1 Tax=Polystyrenella longa TaxID=2528007 RepID=A0A518CR84_9PLAN|nr:GTP 3',8-cyclase MoaA [Polystyrenella longa]QDU81723.1 Cyclic pyranopterin monophosphate synthase [Polystyrenella longa]
MPLNLLTDTFGRQHNNLRISVTDRCNLRCFYCMPADNVQFMDRKHLLTFEEIEQFVRMVVKVGVNKIRITGGEPLVRKDLHLLIAELHKIPELIDIGITTNAMLLPEQAHLLKEAGLSRVNISLDALSPEKFKQITRREGYEKTLEGIQAAQDAGFDPIKINAVSVRGVTEEEIVPFGEFARKTGLEIRFIEFMPLDAENAWEREKVLFAHEIIEKLSTEIMPLEPTGNNAPTAPATEFQFADGIGKIGFISSVSRPFCQNCNRFRLTADGKMRNCLFSLEETDIKSLLRAGASEEEVLAAVRGSIHDKKEGHEINTARFIQPDRPMHSIGG